MTDPSALADTIRTSGWAFHQTQQAGGDTTLSVWDAPHGEIIYSSIPQETRGARMWDCHVAVDGQVSPSFDHLRNALLSIIRDRTLREIRSDPASVDVEWRPALFELRNLTINPTEPDKAGKIGLAIQVSSTQYDPVESLFGT
jgi:hypothetical protein